MYREKRAHAVHVLEVRSDARQEESAAVLVGLEGVEDTASTRWQEIQSLFVPFFFFFGVHRIPCLVKRACKELVEAWVWDIMNSVDYVEKRPFFFLYQKGQVANKKYYEAL